MKTQVFHIATYILFVCIVTLVTAHMATARPGTRTQSGKCRIHREYKNDRRIMQYFSQDIIEELDAGITKDSCARACKKRGLLLPEDHLPHLRDATKVFFACQYNSLKKETTQYGPVFNANVEIASLKVQKKEDKKKSRSRTPSARYTPRRNSVDNIVREAAPPPAPPLAPQPPNADGGVATRATVIDQYAPITQPDIPSQDPNTSRKPENYERQRRTIRRPRIY